MMHWLSGPVRGRLWLILLAMLSAGPRGGLAAGFDAAQIHLPPGFHIELFADNVADARSLALGRDGTVYVGTRVKGNVYAVVDRNHDGRADHVYTLATGLTMPNGVAMVGDDLYVAEVPRLIRFPGISSRLENPPEAEEVYDWLPTDLHHGWKYLRQGPDGKLYFGIGAPCNVCRSEKEVYATLARIDTEGTELDIVAHGVRDSVGFDWHPLSGEMYFNDNGRDWMGDDQPPDELNQLGAPGRHFGFPFCHGDRIRDPELGGGENCSDYTPPVWKYPAHVAPLGMRFYTGSQFPQSYRNQLFVAQHGSWNRKKPQGYRIVLLRFRGGAPVSSTVFADGWLDSSGVKLGRPVDLLQLEDGSLLVSDDKRGAIYRIYYRAEESETSPDSSSSGVAGDT